MKHLLLPVVLSGLIFSSPAQEANPAVLPAEAQSLHFAKVLPHVELGGRHFSYEDYSFLTHWAGFLDKALDLFKTGEKTAFLPRDFSIAKVADDLGLLSLKAVATSSRAHGPLWHNRSFYYLPEGRKGIFTLYGGEAKSYASPALAPADADLITEFDLNVKDASAALVDAFRKIVPPPEMEQFDAALQQAIPGMKATLGDLMTKTQAHLTFIGRMDDKKRLVIPDSPSLTLPAPESALVIDGMGWFLEDFKAMIVKQMDGQEPFTMKIDGDVTTVALKTVITPPPLAWRPVMRFEGKTGRLIVASDAKFMASLLSAEPRLQTGAVFKAAMRGLPEQGNSLAFVSPRLQKEVRQLMLQSLEKSPDVQTALEQAKESQAAAYQLLEMIIGIILPENAGGLAVASANHTDGILVASNLQFSLTTSLTETISAVAIGASIALPTMNSMVNKAKTTQTMNNAKQVAVALHLYANEKGKFPETLAELTKEALVTEEVLKCVNPVTGKSEEWIYHASLMKPEDYPAGILLAAPFITADLMRMVVYADGSVATISEEEYTTKMKNP